MTTEEILRINCETEHGRQELNNYLLKIPVIKKKMDGSEDLVPFNLIEKCIHLISVKYNFMVMNIQPFYGKEHDKFIWYTSSAKNTKTHAWLGTCYGVTIIEVMAKMLIMLYAESRKQVD